MMHVVSEDDVSPGKGVEHTDVDFEFWFADRVIYSLIPKGVEHAAMSVAHVPQKKRARDLRRRIFLEFLFGNLGLHSGPRRSEYLRKDQEGNQTRDWDVMSPEVFSGRKK